MSFETEATSMVEGFPAELLRRFAALVVAEMAVQEGAVLGALIPDVPRSDVDQATFRAMMIAVPR